MTPSLMPPVQGDGCPPSRATIVAESRQHEHGFDNGPIPVESGICRTSPPTPSHVPEMVRPRGHVSGSSRFDSLVKEHFALIWRMAQRLGLQAADAEDVALRVLMIASDRLEDIVEGSERSFLMNTARFVVAKARKAKQRRPETLDDDLSELAADSSCADEVIEQRRALAQLDRVLGEMPEDLRAVFVLFEVEGFSQSEIGTSLGIPQGTVASRIRRAKQRFLRIATRLKLLPRGAVK